MEPKMIRPVASDEIPHVRQLASEPHELSAFLTRMELEVDSDYWNRVRRRSGDDKPEDWVNVEDLSAG